MKHIKKAALSILFLVFLLSNFYAIVRSGHTSSRTHQNIYPAPPTQVFLPGSNNAIRKLYLPKVQIPWVWEYKSVTPPPNSLSYYIYNYQNNALYNLGLTLGVRDKNLPGKQESFVFLDFGQPYEENGVLGVQSPFNLDTASLSEVKEMVYWFAEGYYIGTGIDTQSTVMIGIGTTNYDNQSTPAEYVTSVHGAAWADMVINSRIEIKASTNNSVQVDEAASSDIELSYNSPDDTRAWVDGANTTFLNYADPDENHVFYIITIGDAEGCPFETSDNNFLDSDWGSNCGSGTYNFNPPWSPNDIRYMSFGCQRCFPIPMVYSKDWTNSAQWTMLSRWSVVIYGYSIDFWGSTTMYTDCESKGITNTNDLCTTPQEGYKKFYSALNSFPETTDTLRWSTDMSPQN